MGRKFDYGLELIYSGVNALVSPPVGGAINVDPEKEMLTEKEIKAMPNQYGGVDGIVDMNNMPTYNQGNTPHCGCYADIGAIETMLVSKYMDKGIYFDREFYSALLRKAGIINNKGAYIHRILQWFKDNNITDTRGNVYDVVDYKPVEDNKIIEVMGKGFPVITGAFWGWKYHDSNYVFQPKTLSTGGGHFTLLNMVYPIHTLKLSDGTLNEQYYIGNETSWGSHFGIKKKNSTMGKGIIWLRECDIHRLFTSYIFTDVIKLK